jgi:hypothetical protein
MTWLLPSRFTASRSRKLPTASAGCGAASPASAGPRRARIPAASPPAPVSSGSVSSPSWPITSRASKREARICTWLSTEALSRVSLAEATVAPSPRLRSGSMITSARAS